MSNKTNLIDVISSEIISILEDATPDAPSNSIFGKYLWGDNKMRRDGIKEPNTNEENEFLYMFRKFVNGGDTRRNFHIIIDKFLRPLKQKGLYSKYINPPNKPVYRGMSVSEKEASDILRLPIEEIQNKTRQVWYVSGGGIINPTNKLMSWTTSPKTGVKFSKEHGHAINNILLLLVSIPNKNGNDFYLNPENMLKNFTKLPFYYRFEKETISYGPVEFSEAVFYNIKINSKSRITKKTQKELKDILYGYLTKLNTTKDFGTWMQSDNLQNVIMKALDDNYFSELNNANLTKAPEWISSTLYAYWKSMYFNVIDHIDINTSTEKFYKTLAEKLSKEVFFIIKTEEMRRTTAIPNIKLLEKLMLKALDIA